MATVAIYSPKGGVGKTSLAVNLAWAAAAATRRTLLWDLDPQGAATLILAHDRQARDQAHAAFTRSVAAEALVRPTAVERLALIGADASLRALDATLAALNKRRRLARLLEPLASRYERILLDCPPGLTPLTEQVIRAADLIVVPVIPSPLAQRALDEIAQHLGRRAGLLMPVHVMADRRRALHAQALAAAPDWPVVPMSSAVEAMAAHRAPVGLFQPKSAVTRIFRGLWAAVEARLAA